MLAGVHAAAVEAAVGLGGLRPARGIIIGRTSGGLAAAAVRLAVSLRIAATWRADGDRAVVDLSVAGPGVIAVAVGLCAIVVVDQGDVGHARWRGAIAAAAPIAIRVGHADEDWRTESDRIVAVEVGVVIAAALEVVVAAAVGVVPPARVAGADEERG